MSCKALGTLQGITFSSLRAFSQNGQIRLIRENTVSRLTGGFPQNTHVYKIANAPLGRACAQIQRFPYCTDGNDGVA